MVNIKSHKIIDIIYTRQLDDVANLLSAYKNLLMTTKLIKGDIARHVIEKVISEPSKSAMIKNEKASKIVSMLKF